MLSPLDRYLTPPESKIPELEALRNRDNSAKEG